MNNIAQYLHKDIKVESYGTLFAPDFSLVKDKFCPYCFRKLYEMRNKPLMYCRNKTHQRKVYKVDLQ